MVNGKIRKIRRYEGGMQKIGKTHVSCLGSYLPTVLPSQLLNFSTS